MRDCCWPVRFGSGVHPKNWILHLCINHCRYFRKASVKKNYTVKVPHFRKTIFLTLVAGSFSAKT